jgi:hypothetical protein
MKAISKNISQNPRQTSRENRFNSDLTGADFDISNSELAENQDHDTIENADDVNYCSGGDDFYREEGEDRF